MKATIRAGMRTAAVTLMMAMAMASAAPAQQSASAEAIQQDPVLRAMSLELQRSKDKLQLEDMQRPYYVEYSILDVDLYNAEASFGAVLQEQDQHVRLVRAVVRIGDYKRDSYFGAGQGTFDLLPLDNDVPALRHQLWLATDAAYKQAIQAFTQKQALLKQFESDQPTDDFSREKPAQHIGAVARLEGNRAAWRDALKEATALYTSDPDLQSLQARMLLQAATRYYINSEGTVVRQPSTSYSLMVRGETQAPDGMRLERARSWVVATPGELPSADEIQASTAKVISTLAALRKAPVVEDEYRGPVLFTADAAGDVFASLLGPNILGRKPRPGQTARTVGEYASSYKARVLPDFFSVTDDPTVARFAGRTLLGSYDFDDEGVQARAVNVIDKGVLLNYLVGRQPIRDFTASNGHARAAGPAAPAPAVGNLFVKSLQPEKFEALKQRLLQMCKDQGQPYGYLVESVGARLEPQVLVRIYAKDGHEELVRGAEFQQLDARALRTDVLAAGDDQKVDNRLEAVAQSVVAPSVLFGELQIKRSSDAKDKLPYYPAPGMKLAQSPASSKNAGKEAQ